MTKHKPADAATYEYVDSRFSSLTNNILIVSGFVVVFELAAHGFAYSRMSEVDKGAAANTATLAEVKSDVDDIGGDVDKLKDEFRLLAREVDRLTLGPPPVKECAPPACPKSVPPKKSPGKKKKSGRGRG